jgi:hypothetical protein
VAPPCNPLKRLRVRIVHYLWIAFNGWAACVTGEDRDVLWQGALIADLDLNDRFTTLVADPTTRTSKAALGFAELWPIFRVEELRRLGIDRRFSTRDRAARAREYLGAGAIKFAPGCYSDHNGQPPTEFGHTLNALYRVRCNLFHGEKHRTSENDQSVVAAALGTLMAFIQEAGLLD